MKTNKFVPIAYKAMSLNTFQQSSLTKEISTNWNQSQYKAKILNIWIFGGSYDTGACFKIVKDPLDSEFSPNNSFSGPSPLEWIILVKILAIGL